MPGPRQPSPSELGGESKVLDEPACGFGKVELSGHALEQMRIRGISESDVLQTLRKPDRTGLPTQSGRSRYRWNKTVRVAIDVVWEPLDNRVGVVTAIKSKRHLVERPGR